MGRRAAAIRGLARAHILRRHGHHHPAASCAGKVTHIRCHSRATPFASASFGETGKSPQEAEPGTDHPAGDTWVLNGTFAVRFEARGGGCADVENHRLRVSSAGWTWPSNTKMGIMSWFSRSVDRNPPWSFIRRSEGAGLAHTNRCQMWNLVWKQEDALVQAGMHGSLNASPVANRNDAHGRQ